MITKVLVANRGEIAVRVFRTARAMGCRCVAVYSEADAGAPHVAMADEAVCIGPPAASASYLDAAAILDAAARTGADAVHPGYGFLSEVADFAEAVVDAGLVWVGPPPEAIRAMGDKARAKQRMEAAGVPVVPGYEGDDQGAPRMRAEAERIGYPLLVKAVGGGGGRGMRLVRAADELDEALDGARREAGSAFGNERLMLEAFVQDARHIEIQVFADAHGSVVHLGERDCTTQRRRQKVIEEAPSPVLSAEQRARMGADAVSAARAIGYVGAGTVEMIVSQQGEHCFLEMNTRLQVEHPVTELVTGLDLVEWQLRVAAGEPLPRPHDVEALDGHAIQARLYAEDPSAGFAPQVGPVRWFRPDAVAARPGVRIDAGIAEGGEISPFYDPMVAKVLAHGQTRAEAARRLAMALEDLPLAGLRTNRAFLVRVLRSAAFADATITTHTLDRWVDEGDPLLRAPAPTERAWALAATLLGGPALRSTGGLTLRFAQPEPAERRVGDGAEVLCREPGRVRYRYDGVVRSAFVLEHDGGLSIDDGDGIVRFVEVSPRPADASTADPRRVSSHVAGTVVKVAVAAGDAVAEGDTILIVEAMKMETRLVAARAGTVTEVLAAAGDQIEAGALVARLEIEGDA